MDLLSRWKQRAQSLKIDSYALFLAYKDPRTPWYARVFALCIIAYTFSPIDIIPDFIPVLGYIDDLILVPLGIVIAIKMIPPQVMAECRKQALLYTESGKSYGRTAAIVIICVWLIIAAMLTVWLVHIFTGRL